ncbi:Epidermal growth factor-binding protein type B [Dispira simplex]|nr:Epidermal growth factor-binding protein type B [Dispira simplex]
MVLCSFGWASDESFKPSPNPDQEDEASILPKDLKMMVQAQTLFGPSISIITDITKDGKRDCNGIFLTQLHLLTTAHCVTNKNGAPVDPKRLLVKAVPKETFKSSQRFNVSRVIKHPDFNRELQQEDEMKDTYDSPYHITDRITQNNQGGIFEISSFKGPSGIFARPRKPMGCWEYPKFQQDFKNQNLSHTIICTKPQRENPPCVGKAGCSVWVKRNPGDDFWELEGLWSFSYTQAGEVVHECNNEGKVIIITRLEARLDWIAENTNLSERDLLNGTRDFEDSSTSFPMLGYYSLSVATAHFIFSMALVIMVHAMY